MKIITLHETVGKADLAAYNRGRRKLTDAQAAEARRRREAGELFRTIAADMGVPPQSVHRVYHRKTYADTP